MGKKNKLCYWLYASLLFPAFVALLNGCSSFTQLRTSNENNTPSQFYSLPPGEFGKLWIQRTVKLNIKNPENSSSPLFGNETDGSRRPGRSIPMDINVTYLDSILIRSGLNQFETLAEMGSKDKIEYEKRYRNQFMQEDSHLFWLEMNSTYSSDALGKDKWTFYLEDVKGNTIEPNKITELSSQPVPGQIRDWQAQRDRVSDEHRENNFRLNKKVFILSFSKKGLNGIDFLKNAKTIKMVYFEWATRELKSVGTLDLSGISSNKLELQE